MQVVARDGLEPPPPAFSRPPTDLGKGVWNQRNVLIERNFFDSTLRTIWDQFG